MTWNTAFPPQGGFYVGADVSDSQLLGAYDNLKAAGLEDKIELLKLSVLGKKLKCRNWGKWTHQYI